MTELQFEKYKEIHVTLPQDGAEAVTVGTIVKSQEGKPVFFQNPEFGLKKEDLKAVAQQMLEAEKKNML